LPEEYKPCSLRYWISAAVVMALSYSVSRGLQA